jgi:small conductance mechanosensitive channel
MIPQLRLPAVLQDSTAFLQGARNVILQWEVLLPRLIQTALVILVAIIGYRLLKIFLRRLVEREYDEEDPVEKRLRQQRAQTIAGLLQNVGLVVISAITVLTVLSAFVPIGPMLASVGVLGLAVSFGAQSLVKDIITGTFMLVEGQFAVGDIVRLGDVSGQVERVTLRTTVLRDLHGVVHTVPNGEITRVSNMTKAWSRAVLDVGVAYKENIDHVIDVLKSLGTEFRRDPDWGARLLEEPQVMGVESLGDSAVVIRMAARTLPQQQFDVARELRRRIKNRFDQEGIEIPFPHVTVYWGQGQQPGMIPAPAHDDAAAHLS